MTTNIYDLRTKIIACDSRWSLDNDDYVIYSDRTGYKKIICHNGVFIVFAGYKESVDIFAPWVSAGMDKHSEPKLKKALSFAMIYDGSIVRHSDLIFYRDTNKEVIASFAGSGADFSLPKFDRNFRVNLTVKCLPTESIAFAKDNDIYTGGELTVKNINELTHEDYRYQYISDKEFNHVFTETGYIYMKNENKVVEYKDANDSLKSSVREMVSARQADIAAPFPGMDRVYTQEESKEITSGVRKFFEDHCLL